VPPATPPSNVRRQRRRGALFAGLVLVGGVALGGVTFAAVDRDVATVAVTAERQLRPVGDLAVVFDIGEVDAEVVRSAARAATSAGGTATVSRSGALGMRAIVRGGSTVHAAPDGYLIPTTYVALPAASLGRIVGPDVPPLLGPDRVVMNDLTARLTGAQVGDTIVMQAANGQPVSLLVAGIRPYAQLGGSELVFDYDVAWRLGATYDTRVVIHDFDRVALDAALATEGLENRRDTRVSRSWDARDPDDTLSTARTKEVLGAPWYRFEGDGSVSMHPTWLATNLTASRILLNESIRISARCHVKVVDDLKAALAEIAAAGMGGAIDVANANTYGGCYAGARFSRLDDSQIGFLSRHSFGQALDTNTVSNCQGCVPQMNCQVVRIFRKHGFAWGGNFRRPDGMHFEWVGERRDQFAFDSKYCDNTVNGTTQAAWSQVGSEVLITGLADAAHEHSHTP
jgi:hypothetical protein